MARICPRCGMTVAPSDLYCGNCGNALTPLRQSASNPNTIKSAYTSATAAAANFAAATANAAAAAATSFASATAAAAAEALGASPKPAPDQQQQQVCPYCGHEIASSALYCLRCGRPTPAKQRQNLHRAGYAQQAAPQSQPSHTQSQAQPDPARAQRKSETVAYSAPPAQKKRARPLPESSPRSVAVAIAVTAAVIFTCLGGYFWPGFFRDDTPQTPDTQVQTVLPDGQNNNNNNNNNNNIEILDDAG